MMMTSQKGAELLMALMLAHGAPADAPVQAQTPVVQEAPAMLIAAGEPSAGGPAEAREGAFRELSESEQTRARAVLEAQLITPGSGPAWSLDKIAAMRGSGKSWERIVVLLQRERLIAAGDPARILKGQKPAPSAVAEGELLTGGMGVAAGPAGTHTFTTGLSDEISCGIAGGGTPLTVAAPARE